MENEYPKWIKNEKGVKVLVQDAAAEAAIKGEPPLKVELGPLSIELKHSPKKNK